MDSFLYSLAYSVRRSRGTGEARLKDIPPDKWTAMPSGLNHPAWILGHLALSYDDCVAMSRGEVWDEVPKNDPLFDGGTFPVADPAKYPGKDEMVAEFLSGHDRMLSALGAADPAVTSMHLPERPTVTYGAMLMHLMIDHVWHHLGTLSAWRKAAGLPTVCPLVPYPNKSR